MWSGWPNEAPIDKRRPSAAPIFQECLRACNSAAVTASTIGYGDKVPHRWTGRLVAALVILISLPLFGFFIAQMSSDSTMQQLRTSIHGPEDLPGKRVAVAHGSTSAEYVRQFGAFVSAYDQVDECYDALLTGTVDAVESLMPRCCCTM